MLASLILLAILCVSNQASAIDADADAVVLLATELFRQRHQDRSQGSDHASGTYSIALDPTSNLRLDWTLDYDEDCVDVQVVVGQLQQRSWLAVGFSDRGDWHSADLCVAWKDWKGFWHVQVILLRPP